MICIGTHLMGWAVEKLATIVPLIREIVQQSEKKDYQILVLIQPSEKCLTTHDRKNDQKTWEAAVTVLPDPITLIYDHQYIQGTAVTLAWNILHRCAFEDLRANTFIYIDSLLLNNLLRSKISNPPAVRKKLAELIVKSGQFDYIIGDYTPVPDASASDKRGNDYSVRAKIFIEKW